MDSKRIKPWLGVAAVGVVGVGLLTSGAVQPARAGTKPAHPLATATQQVTMYVFRGKIEGKPGIKGPDGKTHDTIVPANIVVKKGVPVRLVITNFDESSHSITAPSLGLNVVIKPGPSTTTFTFTAKKPGIYRWYCLYPCDKGAGMWAMGQGYSGPGKEGFMAGFIVVLAA